MNRTSAIVVAVLCALIVIALYATRTAPLTAGGLLVQLLAWTGGGAVFAAVYANRIRPVR